MPIKLTGAAEPIDPKPGIYYDVPFEEYQRWDAMSKSLMSAALKSGWHFLHRRDNPPSSESMTFGSLVDTLVLEPEQYTKRFAPLPATYKKAVSKGRGANKTTTYEEKPFNRNSHTCQKILEDIESSGKTVVREDQLDKAAAIKNALWNNPRFLEIIGRCKKQVSICWVDPTTGIKCKGRLDLYDPETHEIWDLKTTMDASPGGFQYLLTKYNYHCQGGVYCMGLKVLTGESHRFGIIAAETSDQTDLPQVALYRLDEESLLAGWAKFSRALSSVSVWLESGITGYSQFIEPIGATSWEIERELAQWEGGELTL